MIDRNRNLEPLPEIKVIHRLTNTQIATIRRELKIANSTSPQMTLKILCSSVGKKKIKLDL